VKEPYEEVVLHIRPDFLKESLRYTPELDQVHALLELSKHGIAFRNEVKQEIGPKMKQLASLTPFCSLLGTATYFA
jgi:hypothetical protein